MSLFAGTESGGRLFKWNNSDAYEQVAPQSGVNTYIHSLLSFNNKLYGGTSGGGALLEWDESDAWIQVAAILNSQTFIYSLIEFNEELYAGTGAGGRLFKWNGVNAWTQVAGQLNSQQRILSLAVFNNKLYGGTYPLGCLFEWNDSDAWTQVAGQYSGTTYIWELLVWNNELYGITQGTAGNQGRLLKWNGSSAWVNVANPLNGQNCLAGIIHNDEIYATTHDCALHKFDGVNSWVQKAPTIGSAGYGLVSYNGKIYASANSDGILREWNDVDNWSNVASELNSQDIQSLAVHSVENTPTQVVDEQWIF